MGLLLKKRHIFGAILTKCNQVMITERVILHIQGAIIHGNAEFVPGNSLINKILLKFDLLPFLFLL